jgi:glycerate kinase
VTRTFFNPFCLESVAQFDVPVVCLSGGLGKDAENVLAHGIDGLMSIVPRPMALEQCVTDAAELVQAAAARLCRLVSIGMKVTAARN